jgi:WD40 repeat protein
VALAHRSREVLVWDGLTGGRLWSWTVPGKPGDEALVQSIGPWPGTIGVALSAAGDRISVIVDGQNVVVLDAFSGRQIIQFPVQSAADTHSRAIPEVELASRHVADMLAPAFASESTVLWARIARIEWGEKLSECWELSHTTPSTFDATSTYLLRAPATQRHDWFAWIEGAQGIRLFNAKDGTAPRLLEGHWDHITRMAFSDDASLLFSVDAVHNVRVWETATGMCRHVLSLPDSMRAEDFQMMSDRPLHDRLDLPLAILPDEYGDRVCVATSRFATVFSWGDRNPLRLLGHESYVYFAAFSPDGARLATMAWGGDARLWNTANGELAGTIQAQDVSTNCTTFSRDGKHLFSWSNANGEIEAELRVFALDTLSLAESIQGQDAALRYLAGATPGATLTKGFEGAQLSQTDANGRVVAAAEWAADWLNVDGVSTAESDMVVVSADLTQALLGIRLPGVSDRPDAGMVTCAISRDGTLLAATPPSGSPIFLYDGWTGKPLGELPGHPARIFSMDFAPDNTRLATGGNDNVTRVWDVQHREQVLELRGHHRYVHAVRFSPDGSQLVTASGDRTVQLWDATLPTD